MRRSSNVQGPSGTVKYAVGRRSCAGRITAAGGARGRRRAGMRRRAPAPGSWATWSIVWTTPRCSSGAIASPSSTPGCSVRRARASSPGASPSRCPRCRSLLWPARDRPDAAGARGARRRPRGRPARRLGDGALHGLLTRPRLHANVDADVHRHRPAGGLGSGADDLCARPPFALRPRSPNGRRFLRLHEGPLRPVVGHPA